MPVGRAPVVVKTTGETLFKPWAVHVITAGLAMVTVTVEFELGTLELIYSPIIPALALLFVVTPTRLGMVWFKEKVLARRVTSGLPTELMNHVPVPVS